MNIGTEILINASHVDHDNKDASFEFILDMDLCVKACIKIDSLSNGAVSHVNNPEVSLDNMLFELNHVRVNPTLDNKDIINCLTSKLKETGISITEQPDNDSMALCFKPLGQINSNVRFTIETKGKIIFMSPIRPKLFCANR